MGALGNSAELEAELIKRNRDIAKAVAFESENAPARCEMRC